MLVPSNQITDILKIFRALLLVGSGALLVAALTQAAAASSAKEVHYKNREWTKLFDKLFKPEYPHEQRAKKVEGDGRFRMHIDTQGKYSRRSVTYNRKSSS